MHDLPWLRAYPSGLRWDAVIDTMPVCQLLDDAVARAPLHIAIEFNGKQLTYAELHQHVAQAAKGLQHLGIRPGTKVGLFLPNTPHYLISFFAVLRIGAVVVNYSPLDAEKVLEHKIEDSETDVVITLDTPTLYPVMEKLLDVTRLQYLVIGNMAEMSVWSSAGSGASSEDTPCQIHWTDRHVRYAELLSNDGRYEPVAVPDLQETAVLQYTGGTTGLPKGAILTHATLTAACMQARLNLANDETGLTFGKETFLVVLPLFHIYALTFNLLLGIHLAAKLLIHSRFDVRTAVRDLTEKGVSVFFGVPTMFTAVNGLPGIEHANFSNLKLSNSGGAPLPVEVHERFQQLTGCTLREGWGMTEVCGVGTNTPPQRPHKIGSCGVPMCGVTIKFVSVDDPEIEVDFGKQGEICIRGPNVMKGYWKNAAASASAMTSDGFLRTGDVGYMDDEGFLWIVDRIKDMLLVSGFNVYPRNIEEAIYRHPSVAEVIVIGVHDGYRGQIPKAYVRLKEDADVISLDQLKVFLTPHLGKHEMIQALELRSELPKTAVGKLSRKELREEASHGPQSNDS